jgi:uncharacterized Fe-S radical SAM superfamily protein PflX
MAGPNRKAVIFIIFEMKYDDLKNCTLCEHRCGVNRLVGESGVCRMTLPQVASATLHPAPPAVLPTPATAQHVIRIKPVR